MNNLYNVSYQRTVKVKFSYQSTVKIKVKFTLEQVTKSQKGSRGMALLFL